MNGKKKILYAFDFNCTRIKASSGESDYKEENQPYVILSGSEVIPMQLLVKLALPKICIFHL
jgi:hypothetical protein